MLARKRPIWQAMSEAILLSPEQLAYWQGWQGKTDTQVDRIPTWPVAALAATLDRADPAPVDGAPLPPLWHWLCFLPHALHSELGADGHPARGGFLPPVSLPRRMWAGARLRWQVDNPLQIGQRIERLSTIRSVTHKAGRSGDLVFVLVEHQYRNDAGLALTEEHDIVYRVAARPDDPAAPPQIPPLAGQAAWSRTITPDPVLLFRYSALTFNGHRIHYDRPYAMQEEGYAGLVVHGPLIATLLIDLLRRQMPDAPLAGFDFRAVRPTVDTHPFGVHGKPEADGQTIALWAQDHAGALTMQATATLA